MPLTMEPRENGHVLYLVASDPLTHADFENSFAEQRAYLESVTYRVHQIVDLSTLKGMPTSVLKVRERAPAFKHSNSGNLVLVGAHGFVRSVGEMVMQLAHFTKVKFVETEAEGWAYLRDVIAGED